MTQKRKPVPSPATHNTGLPKQTVDCYGFRWTLKEGHGTKIISDFEMANTSGKFCFIVPPPPHFMPWKIRMSGDPVLEGQDLFSFQCECQNWEDGERWLRCFHFWLRQINVTEVSSGTGCKSSGDRNTSLQKYQQAVHVFNSGQSSYSWPTFQQATYCLFKNICILCWNFRNTQIFQTIQRCKNI